MKQEYLQLITELRHKLHAHPELSMQEVWTKQTLMDFIKEHTDLEVVDRGHWFYAHYVSGRPGAEKLGFRADFDALPIEETCDVPYRSQNPGQGHKCGHDGHSAALAGLALELNEKGADQDIYLIFQHAEEIGGGGAECAELIAEKGIGQVFAFHNMSHFPERGIAVREGVIQCASKGLTVSFTGASAHASQPEDGKNPAAAISELALFVNSMIAEGSFKGIVLATIVQIAVGGKNFGIAASKGEISMTLRAEHEPEMDELERLVRKKAQELADRDGLMVSYEEHDPFPETVNDPAAVELVWKAAGKLGLPVTEIDQVIRGSEDFGYYLKKCPGAIFYIGNGEDYQALHTCEYDFNDRILETAVEMFWAIVELA